MESGNGIWGAEIQSCDVIALDVPRSPPSLRPLLVVWMVHLMDLRCEELGHVRNAGSSLLGC